MSQLNYEQNLSRLKKVTLSKNSLNRTGWAYKDFENKSLYIWKKETWR